MRTSLLTSSVTSHDLAVSPDLEIAEALDVDNIRSGVGRSKFSNSIVSTPLRSLLSQSVRAIFRSNGMMSLLPVMIFLN